MTYPMIAMDRSRTVRIDYPRLFKDAEIFEDFLIRGFEVGEVVSMEVDRLTGSVIVHFHPRCKALQKVLMRLAEKYEESRVRVLNLSCRPYFILQEEGGRVIYSRAPAMVSGIRRFVYLGLSAMFFGLSIVGVWAPLIPTTPFVILSSYYALRCSPELHDRLLRSRLFGRILNDWHLHRAMQHSTKRRVLIFMVIVFSLTFGLARPTGSALPVALLVSLFSFGFVLQMPTVEDYIAPPRITPSEGLPLAVANLR